MIPPTDRAEFKPIPTRFTEIAQSEPNGLALRTPDVEFTFAEFDALTNRIARAIPASADLNPVAIVCTGEADMRTAQLGVLKSGRPMLPIHPGEPAHRLALMIEECGADVAIVSTSSDAAGLDPRLHIVPLDALPSNEDAFDTGISPEQLAMVEYTSGSTGAPKGIAHSHASLLHFALGFAELGITRSDRVLLASESFGEIIAALVTGAPLFPFDVRRRGFGELARWIRDQRISFLRSPPSVFRALADHLRRVDLPDLRTVVQAGEALSPADVELLRTVLGPATTLVHMYGSSEAGIVCSQVIDDEFSSQSETIPIGMPLPGIEVRLAAPDGEAVDPGTGGEMEVCTPALVTGYLGRPDLTEARFFDEGSKRWFRTGDRARRDDLGRLVFAGRVDDLVKIHGKRVEIAEIEEALRRVPGVAEAAVATSPDHRGSLRLVGYYRATDPGGFQARDLRAALGEALPGYMIPTAWIAVDSFAMTSNGKIDRQALPEPGGGYVDGQPHGRAGRLERIWCDLLGVESVHRGDSFFDLGGDSLAAASLLAAVEQTFECDVDMEALFRDDTLESMSRVIESATKNDGRQLLFTVARGDGNPLLCVHMPGWSRVGYLALSRHMQRRRKVLGVLEPAMPETTPVSIEATARAYADAIREHIPGPYMLLGYSGGGIIAHETARLLVDQGSEVRFVGLVDSGFPAGRLRMALRDQGIPGTMRLAYKLLMHRIRMLLVRSPRDLEEAESRREQRALSRSMRRHRLQAIDAPVIYFAGSGRSGRLRRSTRPWLRYADEVVEVPGTHAGSESVMSEPNVGYLATAVEERLALLARDEFH